MKFKYVFGMLLAIIWLILDGQTPALVAAQPPAGSQLNLLSANSHEVVVELTVSDFEAEAVEHEGQTYQRLVIPGAAQSDIPGAPQLPVQGALLGLPTSAGISVQLLEADSEVLPGYRLYPAPTIRVTGDDPFEIDWEEVFTLDQELYATDAFYPDRPLAIGQTGFIRDQAVARVQFSPIQYNPVTGELRFYRRMVARVTWDTSLAVAAKARSAASPAYEKLLQSTLLNYGTLDRPPARSGPVPLPNDDAESNVVAADATSTLKIGVIEDGLYELTYGDLTGAGLDLSGVDPRTVKISNRGTEIHIYVPGESDGVFDPTDTVLFYGTSIKNDKYTNKNVYWLTTGGSNGQRMGTRDGTLSGGATVPGHFLATLHVEENTEYWLHMFDGDDHFFWGSRLTVPESVTHPLTISNISTSGSVSANVRVRLQGYTNTDHRTKVYLNSTEIDDQGWNGRVPFTHTVTAAQTLLNEGVNNIQVEGVDTGALVDRFYLNWIELDYWDTYVAENDELRFGAPAAGTYQFEVTNFSDSSVAVFDVTDSTNVVRITNTSIVDNGGSYELQFEDTATAGTRYLALTPARYKSPASIELDQPSTWQSSSNGADYVIITHEDFYNDILPLATHHSTAGLRVATVKVGDIYDEFNDGIFSPQAIRDFLTYAYNNWVAPAPTYVLLVGDAFYDYKNLMAEHAATKNYVPTQLIETDLLAEAPSDNWFVTVSGADNLPDMFIGRLSAQTSTEVDNMVDKIIQYDQSPPPSPWNRRALFVADDDSSSFELTSEELASLLPADYTANKVYVDDYPPGDPTVDISNYINSGSLLVNYTGHGNLDRWGLWNDGGGNQQIFWNPDIVALNNTHKLPVVTIGDCLNGYFAWQETGGLTSVAEQFLRLEDKGAVAVWAATGKGFTADHRPLLTEFYEIIFQDKQYNLGAATTAAKIAIAGTPSRDELIDTFVLIGDPGTNIGVPAGAPGDHSTYLPIIIK